MNKLMTALESDLTAISGEHEHAYLFNSKSNEVAEIDELTNSITYFTLDKTPSGEFIKVKHSLVPINSLIKTAELLSNKSYYKDLMIKLAINKEITQLGDWEPRYLTAVNAIAFRKRETKRDIVLSINIKTKKIAIVANSLSNGDASCISLEETQKIIDILNRYL